MDTLNETVERSTQSTELVLTVDGQALGQVAFTFGDVFHRPDHRVQRLQQDTDQQAEQRDNDGHRDKRGNDCRGAEITEHRVGLVLVDGQADVPIGRGQALDRREGQQTGLAIGLDLGQLGRQPRCVRRVQIRQRLHHQRVVRVDKDLALVVDQEGITHTAEVQRVDNFHQAIQRQIAADHANIACGGGHHRNHHFAGADVNIGFGQDRTVGGHPVFVPGPHARVITVRHLGLRANGETTVDVTQVNSQET
ncbi:hypothetical protein D3C81_1079860 [compost metagenome]